MANEPRESKTLEDVRRWRREVYEADQKLTLEERRRRETELAAKLGLRVIPANPEAAPRRRAS
jgi:hypothetical protein